MSFGYRLPLYLLPFDDRHSYVSGMFGFTPPLSGGEHDAVAESKQVIYDGFRHALGDAAGGGVPHRPPLPRMDHDLRAGAAAMKISPMVAKPGPPRVEASAQHPGTALPAQVKEMR
jgi:hypothetical protein